MIISIINVCSSTYIDNSYRFNEILLLNKLGLSNNDVSHIFNFKSIILTFIGSILGFLTVQLISIIHSKYGIIEIPSEIYYMNELPLEIDYIFASCFISIMLVMISFLNFFTIKRFLRNKQVSL